MVKQYDLNDYYNFTIKETFTDDELHKEWRTIQTKNYGYASGNSWNKLIKQFQFDELFKIELDLWKSNKTYKGLPLRSWIYANRKKYIGKGYGELSQFEILRAFKITGIHISYSFHSPFYIKQFIKDFNIKSIYDPCGGWGHRMLGACAANAEYSYNDVNPATHDNCIRMMKFLGLSCYMYNNDAASFTPSESYDAVFTCPPYHNTEWYSKYGAENFNYKGFLNWWRLVVTRSCLNKESCKYFAFVINHIYENDMSQLCSNLGLKLIEEQFLGSSKQISHLNAKSNNKKYEKLLVFEKS